MNDRNNYDPNQSPAAKRRQLRGKRSVEDFENYEYRPDMSEHEILEAWEWENTRDWTRRLPSVQEREEALRHAGTRLDGTTGRLNTRAKSTQEISERRREAESKQRANRGRKGNRPPKSGIPNVSGEEKRAKRKRKISVLTRSMIINIYSLSMIALLVMIMFVNILPLVYFIPLTAVVLVTNWFIRKSYQIGYKFGSKFWASTFTFIHAVVIYYMYLIFGLMYSLSGENMGELLLWNDTFHVYISGNDTFDSLEYNTRSDVNLIATLNSRTGQMMITTTPRDYYVVIPGISGDKKDKLTHAGNYGPEASMSTLSNIYNEDINQYVRVNFSSVIGIIDALGGVTVASEVEFLADHSIEDVKQIVIGKNHLTGEQALAFVRERYDFTDGDAQRARNQQALIVGIMKELLSPTILLKSDAVFGSIAQNIDTNMSVSQMQRAIKSVLKGVVYTTIQNVEAQGNHGRDYCYSHAGGTLYVSIPIQDSIDEITEMMNGVRSGKKYYIWEDEEVE